MKAHWWSCLLGLLCTPAEVMLSILTASQNPSSISLTRVNSSAEITCSTSLSNPLGLYLLRRFHSNSNILYLALNKSKITKRTVNGEFTDRLYVPPSQPNQEGCRVTIQLSLLGLQDTNLYYCTWTYLKSNMPASLSSNGTVVIIREKEPQDQCRTILDFTFISLSITAFIVILFVFIGALIFKCRRFKKHFRPATAVRPPRPSRPQHICCQQRADHHPYLVTSVDSVDFRRIL